MLTTNNDMVDVYKLECIIRKNEQVTLFLQREFCDWLCEFAPTHFISIQFPTNQRSKSMEISRDYLGNVMKYFEKQFDIRHWFKHILPFIGFAEQNDIDRGKWHFHLFLQNNRYTEDKVNTATKETIKHFKFSPDVIDIQQIDRTPYRAYKYATKDIKANKKGHFDDSRVFLSNEMFYERTKRPKSANNPFVVAPLTNRILTINHF